MGRKCFSRAKRTPEVVIALAYDLLSIGPLRLYIAIEPFMKGT